MLDPLNEDVSMKLGLKLPLAFALALGLLFLGDMFGISRLHAALDVHELKVMSTVATNTNVALIDAKFSTAIQE